MFVFGVFLVCLFGLHTPVRIRENTDQKNSEYEHFIRGDVAFFHQNSTFQTNKSILCNLWYGSNFDLADVGGMDINLVFYILYLEVLMWHVNQCFVLFIWPVWDFKTSIDFEKSKVYVSCYLSQINISRIYISCMEVGIKITVKLLNSCWVWWKSNGWLFEGLI